jgi:intracellular multiplication protein IcmB
MGAADTVIDHVTGISSFFKDLITDRDPRNIIDIAGIDSEYILNVNGLSLLSVIKIDGFLGIAGSKDWNDVTTVFSEALKERLRANAAFSFKLYIESDPDSVETELVKNFQSQIAHAKACNLDMEDIIEEKIKATAKFTQVEKIYLAIYTLPKAVDPKSINIQKVAKYNSGLSEIVVEAETLRNIHIDVCKSISGLLSKSFKLAMLPSVTLLDNIYTSLNGASVKPPQFSTQYESETNKTHIKNILQSSYSKLNEEDYSEKSFLREVTANNNKSAEPILPEPLGHQLISGALFDTGSDYVVSGDRIYAPVSVTKFGTSPKDFDFFVRQIRGTPFRMVYTLTSDGLSFNFVDDLLTTLFSWLGDNNRMKHNAIKKLKALSAYVPIVGFSLSVITWCKAELRIDDRTRKSYYPTEEIARRRIKLMTAINDWRGATAKPTAGDLTECYLSTIPGLIAYHCVKRVSAPLIEVARMMPLTRPTTPWESGSCVYRSADGAVLKYSQMSTKQLSDVVLICGEMGGGKSAHIASLNRDFLFDPAASVDLPYLRGLEFGYSQSAIVQSIAHSLPPNQRHRARYEQLRNSVDYAFNLFDLPLGQRYPMDSHKAFLVNFMLTFTHSMSNYQSHQGLITYAVDLLYKNYSDAENNPNAKKYRAEVDRDIADYIAKNNLPVEHAVTSWYKVTDMIAATGNYRLAKVAQRYAVPIIPDFSNIASNAELKREYDEEWEGKPVTEHFARSIRESIETFPMLCHYTHFDISDSPIFIADLKDLIPTNVSGPALVNAAIIYIAVMRLLCADFFTDEQDLPYINPDYYAYHAKRIETLTVLKKRFFVDEKHRVNPIPTASKAIDQMVFEGRKYKISIMQGSQLLNHFSPDIVTLASSVFIFGKVEKGELTKMAAAYELSDHHIALISSLRGPDSTGANFFARFKLREGKTLNYQLINTEGPLMMCMVASEAEDRAVRNELFKQARRLSDARRAYAKEFPSGSVKEEVKRREELRSQNLYESKTNSFTKDIALDIIERYNLRA